MLLHLVDVSEGVEGDPVENFIKINRELRLYSETLSEKPQAVVGTKIDIAGNMDSLLKLSDYCGAEGLKFFALSAATGKGIRKLLSFLSLEIEKSARQPLAS